MGLVRHTAEIALQQCPVCGVEVPRRKTYCSNACRQKWYRDNPALTPAKIVKQQRREDRTRSKIERHIRGKANVSSSHVGLPPKREKMKRDPVTGEWVERQWVKDARKARVELLTPEVEIEFNDATRRSHSAICASAADALRQQRRERVVPVASKHTMSPVGVTVVEPGTVAKVKKLVDADMPDYLMPVVLDVELRRGVSWEHVKLMREDRQSKPKLKEPFFWNGPNYGPRLACGSFLSVAAGEIRVLVKESATDTNGHRATTLPTSRRGNRKRVRISRRKNWCADCKGYLSVKHDCVVVAT
jgi:hypothetical protein